MSQTFVLRKNHPLRESVYRNILAQLKKLYESGRSIKAEFSEYRNTRSLAQNAALFGHAYVILSEETGFSPDDLHTAFCRREFGTVEIDVGGVIISKPFRTTTIDEHGKRDVIDTIRFSKFFETVRQVAAEAGIVIPDPDPFHGQGDDE